MLTTRTLQLVTIIAVVLMIGGCAKRYIITEELSGTIPPSAILVIGQIIDELPLEKDEEDKPSIENIEMFKEKLEERLLKKNIFADVVSSQSSVTPDHRLSGSIISYKRGSGFLRFLFSFLGASEVTVELKITHIETGQIVFAGNFTGKVSSELEKGDKMFDNVAKDFAKALEKAL